MVEVTGGACIAFGRSLHQRNRSNQHDLFSAQCQYSLEHELPRILGGAGQHCPNSSRSGIRTYCSWHPAWSHRALHKLTSYLSIFPSPLASRGSLAPNTGVPKDSVIKSISLEST